MWRLGLWSPTCSKGFSPLIPSRRWTKGVGFLLRRAVDAGRAANGGLDLGVCGEHGGDPASVGFCHALGLDYVSCSPFRVPVARLAAAHAALDDEP